MEVGVAEGQQLGIKMGTNGISGVRAPVAEGVSIASHSAPAGVTGRTLENSGSGGVTDSKIGMQLLASQAKESARGGEVGTGVEGECTDGDNPTKKNSLKRSKREYDKWTQQEQEAFFRGANHS